MVNEKIKINEKCNDALREPKTTKMKKPMTSGGTEIFSFSFFCTNTTHKKRQKICLTTSQTHESI
jgi:hypothetical protein